MTSLLDIPIISRIRRNHGMEHATLHILGRSYPHVAMGGISMAHGYYILAEVPAEAVLQAAQKALMRLNGGEAALAVHPNCGTLYATSGVMAGVAAWLGMLGTEKTWQSKLWRLPVVIMLVMGALIIAKPLGVTLQRQVTTSPQPQALQIVNISTRQLFGKTIHKITTQG